MYTSYALAAPQTSPSSQNTPADLKILSDTMECYQEKQICIAKGHARAEKLNDPQKRTITAEILTAYFTKDGPDGKLKLTRLEAENDVFITTGDTIVQGKRATYEDKSEIAKVYEDVKVSNGHNHLSGGSEGEVNMKTGHYKVLQGPHQVETLLYTKDGVKK